ncbi:WD40 repeat domain-containing protein [Aggregatibacter aphrophilus]|uniref:WD40 repeat domain-containing protein n=2 Tax=Aggregatibacter aphrophilus TaxID=732 RepID=A0A3S4PSQ3_AGGAP|nr:hypothetical protein [Aggregatibacter aphrophilus]KNE84677.1 hypothetical protein ATCC33389_0209495 [Aggregatibacter aphrophilus ATCC 33389]OBY53787.1 hypothetical protein BBB51_06200 [Aggregatibacter aphrophilus]RDE88536.1 WD40 repeat domain-containing protein [Aggregatibacter aphrophilus]VEF42482.1 Uncharacterised protein [Aggregatibacter aphrophilus ATCC 33389]
MERKWKIVVLVIVIMITLFIWLRQQTAPVISLSVSTDGRYVVSGHADRKAHPSKPIGQLVLWDIEKKTKTVLSKNANAFSAMFIPDSHEFMWQDDKDIIYMQNTDRQVIKSFQHPFTLQNHRITANKSFYLSADMYNHLYLGQEDALKPVYTDGAATSKPVDLSIVGDYFLSVTPTCYGPNDPVAETNLTANPINPSEYKKSSYDGVTLWDKNTLKPVAKLNGNCGSTSGLISPDGKWVITGGENVGIYMWEINNVNHRLNPIKIHNGNSHDGVNYYDAIDSSPIAEKFKDKIIYLGQNAVAIAFINEKDFIAIGKTYINEDNYNVIPLYVVGDNLIKDFLEIDNSPTISTNYYQRNLSVSSSPKAHILVTGQATGGGINVYKYHPEKMELEKIWVAD